MRASLRLVVSALALQALHGAAAAAQQTSQLLVRVHIVDSSGAPVGNADVTVLRGLTEVAATGVTDDAGRRTLSVPHGGAYELVVRRIGFQRGNEFFRGDRESIDLRIVLHRSTQQLPAVKVTAAEDLKRKSYHIDADDIAASQRPIIDGWDVVTKLRPDMIHPRPQSGFDPCGLYYVWVNGRRIMFAPVNDALAAKAAMARRGAKATPHIGVTGIGGVPLNVQSVLSSIHPEHIAEMNYADCNDFSVNATRARNAVFVTLKPGIAFEPGTGSFVADEPVRAVDQLANKSTVAEQVQPTAVAAAPYRARLLGVYDGSTGDPVVDAEVADSASGTFARTTQTGTVSLVFLPEGVSTVRVHKPGYTDAQIAVSISAHDSVPITLVLSKPK
ncbi:MAG: carboxypeptidase-like regulatory domain-containing protein [bacterium]